MTPVFRNMQAWRHTGQVGSLIDKHSFQSLDRSWGIRISNGAICSFTWLFYSIIFVVYLFVHVHLQLFMFSNFVCLLSVMVVCTYNLLVSFYNYLFLAMCFHAVVICVYITVLACM